MEAMHSNKAVEFGISKRSKSQSYYPNLPKRERKLASRGGGWALGSQAIIVNKKIKVDKVSLIISMGFYKKGYYENKRRNKNHGQFYKNF